MRNSSSARACTAQLDQLTARLDFDAAAQPVVDTAALSDPRWERPYSGLYWQLDGAGRTGVLRSRSLWDQALVLPADRVADDAVHLHEATGPLGRPVLVLERSVHDPRQPQAGWRLAVAADTAPLDEAVQRFRGQLALSLLVLFALLLAASWIQVLVGLAPLRALREALESVRGQGAQRLQGRFPAEVQPLVDEFNGVLEQNAAMVEQARKHAGNLAHAVKTPLAVLRQVGDRLSAAPGAPVGELPELGRLMHEQVDLAARHVDWHLARSRSAALGRPGGQATRVEPVLQGLARVMARVHSQRGLAIAIAPLDAGPCVPGRGTGPAGDPGQPAGQRLQVGAQRGPGARATRRRYRPAAAAHRSGRRRPRHCRCAARAGLAPRRAAGRIRARRRARAGDRAGPGRAVWRHAGLAARRARRPAGGAAAAGGLNIRQRGGTDDPGRLREGGNDDSTVSAVRAGHS